MGKQRKRQNGTPQVEEVARAPFETPLHPRQEVKRFRHVGEYDDLETRRADELENRGYRLSPSE